MFQAEEPARVKTQRRERMGDVVTLQKLKHGVGEKAESCGFVSALRFTSNAINHHLKVLSRKETQSEVFMVIASQRWETETWRGLGTCLRTHSWPVALLEQWHCWPVALLEHTAISSKSSWTEYGRGSQNSPKSPPITGEDCKLTELLAKLLQLLPTTSCTILNKETSSAVLKSYLICFAGFILVL